MALVSTIEVESILTECIDSNCENLIFLTPSSSDCEVRNIWSCYALNRLNRTRIFKFKCPRLLLVVSFLSLFRFYDFFLSFSVRIFRLSQWLWSAIGQKKRRIKNTRLSLSSQLIGDRSLQVKKRKARFLNFELSKLIEFGRRDDGQRDYWAGMKWIISLWIVINIKLCDGFSRPCQDQWVVFWDRSSSEFSYFYENSLFSFIFASFPSTSRLWSRSIFKYYVKIEIVFLFTIKSQKSDRECFSCSSTECNLRSFFLESSDHMVEFRVEKYSITYVSWFFSFSTH